MPPKVKISGEDVLTAALNIVRQHGLNAVNARSVAASLQCSTQPIFSNYPSMDCLKKAVVERATTLYRERLERETADDRWPPYKATGMGYIRFATEEPELFKMLFMAPQREGAPDDRDWQHSVAQAASTGIPDGRAELFHLEMWLYVHGIAVMVATGSLSFDTEQISMMLTDAYVGLRHRHMPCQEEGQL